jgi:hypothetical protein
MLIYLDHALKKRHPMAAREDRGFTTDDLKAAIMEGAVERVRPKMITVVAHHGGAASDNVESRNWIGGHAAHCRADDRRNGIVERTNLDRDPRNLRIGEGLEFARGHAQSSATYGGDRGVRTMRDMMTDMMWGMGVGHLVVIVLVILRNSTLYPRA